MVMAPSAIIPSPIDDFGTLSVKTFDPIKKNNVKHRHELAIDGADLSRELIGNALKERAERIDEDTCAPGDEDAFFVADLGEVYRQHARWTRGLKRVQPHYGESMLSRIKVHYSDMQNSCQVQPRPPGSPPALRSRRWL